MKRYCLLIAVVTLATASAPASAQSDRLQGRALPASIEGLKLEQSLTINATNPMLDRNLATTVGRQQVIVRLKGAPVARGGIKSDIEREQSEFLVRCLEIPSARAIAQVHNVLNAVFLEIDAADLPALAGDAAVQTIKQVVNYEMDLSETVPYIGASTVQAFGADGEGVSVAVLDSGVDYTHAGFGGAATLAAYEAAYGTDAGPLGGDSRHTVLDGQFPSGRVVGGFDFLGEDWPFGPLAPDPDPISSSESNGGGHGTHVADIIGGADGVAPKVDLYAVKICAAYANACSGIGLIQGMDFAVDPNGDGDTSDAVDIINMSLGGNYGSPFNDDLAAAVDNATALGVITVAAAGNGGDKPYVQGTPAGAQTAISVAQTTVPSAGFPLIDVGPLTGIFAVFQTWSTPPAGIISATTVFGGAFGSDDGCSLVPGSEIPADSPYSPGTFAGEIVLVNRGRCNFSEKIRNIEVGGAAAGIIGLVAPGAPFGGAFGGTIFPGIPGYMISQADSLAIQGVVPAAGTIDPANFFSAAMSMVGSSSRGPQIDDNRIKPEIGAPGASVSAAAGTGTGTTGFGGTSGASPMVAGSVALLIDSRNDPKKSKGKKKSKAKKKNITLVEAKSLLMNTAEIDIANNPLIGDLAPVSRIGGGEVRVDLAAISAVSAWDNDDPAAGGALSFGQVDVADGMVLMTKSVRVRNRSGKKISYDITPTFRTPGPEGSGAVAVSAPASITVQGNKNGNLGKDTVFDVTLTIDGSLLPGNSMNSGSNGADGAALTANEFDGYLLFEVDQKKKSKGSKKKSKGSKKKSKGSKKAKLSAEPIHVAWHVLPRQAARVVPSTTMLAGGGFPEVIGLTNTGVGTAQNDAYSLIALSPDIPEGGAGGQAPTPDIASVGINTFGGFGPGSGCTFIWAFAINTHERQRHLIQPVSHQITLDTNQDGIDDYVVLNRDFSFDNVTDGRQLTWVFNLSTGVSSAFFFAEHATNTGNAAMFICGEQVGLTDADFLATNVDITSIFAQDFYYGGPGDEVVAPGTLTVTPLGERFFGLPSDVAGNTNDPTGLRVFDFGLFPGNTPELGVLLITNGDRGTGARGGATEATEALVFTAPGVVVP